MSKYPYIPDKKMYAAVMGACKWIREDGYFNKAVSYYADKYGVSRTELAKHVRARQAAGQMGKKREKYKYYILDGRESSNCGMYNDNRPVIVKATSAENARKHFYKEEDRTMRRAFESQDLVVWHEVLGEYETREEAREALAQMEAVKRNVAWCVTDYSPSDTEFYNLGAEEWIKDEKREGEKWN